MNKVPVQKDILLLLQEHKRFYPSPSDYTLRKLSDTRPIGYLLPCLEAYFGPIFPQIQSRLTDLNIVHNPLPKLLDGSEIMKRGFEGKKIGMILDNLREEQFLGKITTTTQALKWLSKQ